MAFSTDYKGYGIFCWVFAAFFGILFSSAGHPNEGIGAAIVFPLISTVCFAAGSRTVFDNGKSLVTDQRGLWPWRRLREIRYADIDKILLYAFASSSGHSVSITYELRLFVRGNPRFLKVATVGEESLSSLNARAEELATTSRLPLERSPSYASYRERSLETRGQRSIQARWTISAAIVSSLVGAYFTAAHNGAQLPFAESVQGLYANKSNTGPGIQYIAWILGVALGMIGTANYFQSRG